MRKADRRHHFHTELLCRLVTAMPGNDLIAVVGEDRIDEPELLDAFRDLADLLARVNPRIPRVRLLRFDADVFGLHFTPELTIEIDPATNPRTHLNPL